MPFYELFALAKPWMERTDHYAIIRTAANAVLSGGGVLADIKSYGQRPIAYDIRVPGNKHDSAYMWQIGFKAAPTALPQLEYGLKVDERVLRYVLLKRDMYKRMPTTHKVAKMAAANLRQDQQRRLQAARDEGKALWWDPERQQDDKFRFTDPATGEEALLDNPLAQPEDSSEQLTSSIDDQRALWREPGPIATESGQKTGIDEVATELTGADAGAFRNPPQVEQAAEEDPTALQEQQFSPQDERSSQQQEQTSKPESS